MSRRDARGIAFKLIFEYIFSTEEKSEMVDEYSIGLSEDDKSYISEVYYGVISHYDDLTEKIASNTEKFAFDRLFKVDLALLYLSLYEIIYMPSIPYKVSVDEVLHLAKNYSTEKSVKYINGVLKGFAR